MIFSFLVPTFGNIGLENPHSSHTKFSENPKTSISPPRILRTSLDLHLGHILVVFIVLFKYRNTFKLSYFGNVMGFLRYARHFILIALVIWCIFLIHPFNPEGVIITGVSGQAAIGLRTGDYIENINGFTIETIEDFQNALNEINPDDTVHVSAKRETFPYRYIEVKYSFIAGERKNETDLGIFVAKSSSSNLLFSHELSEGRKYIVSSEQENAIEVIKNRLEINNIGEYDIYEENERIIIITSSRRDLTPIIETKGNFEARIGDETFFTVEDINRICTKGLDCPIVIYQDINETREERSLVWRYEFEVFITEEASQRFAQITEDLSIAYCRHDVCVLNETIDYYIDGIKIGSERIFDGQKGRPYRTPMVGGTVLTNSEARNSLSLTQSLLKGELEANVEEIESAEPKYTMPLFRRTIDGVIGIIALTGIVSFVILKKPFVSLTGILNGVSELIIVLGIIAGLNLIISVQTLVGLLFVGFVIFGYQNYSCYKFKKEGIILRKVDEFSSKLNKWLLIAIGIFFVLLFIVRDFSTPVFIQLIVIIILTKAIFFSSIKK